MEFTSHQREKLNLIYSLRKHYKQALRMKHKSDVHIALAKAEVAVAEP